MLRNSKKVLSFILSATLVLSGISIISGKVQAEAEDGYGLKNPRVTFNYSETVTFGNYWQEDLNGDGEFYEEEKQPIVWRILEKYDDGTALVMSDKLLDNMPYNYKGVLVEGDDGEKEYDYSCTWENSTIREWLNTDFYNTAFSSNEKEAIVESDVVNEKNPSYDTDSGNNTKDKVFILSITEAMSDKYGFSKDGQTSQTRMADITTYAKKNQISSGCDATGRWWLRTSGDSMRCASWVSDNGFICIPGNLKNDKYIGVRPCIKINLQSTSVKESTPVKNSIKESEWDTVSFGKYDNKEITWRVLDISGNDAYLISDLVLTDKAYNEEYTSITWKDSSLRKWLNEDFYNDSFTESEKNMIKTTTVLNNDDTYYGTAGGDDTLDKVFLLSREDINQSKYGFPEKYCTKSDTRVAFNTEGKEMAWWLRSPGSDTNEASEVHKNGYVGATSGYADDSFEGVSRDYIGVRPALHIDLKSSAWKKGNVVNSNKNVNNEPTTSPKVTPTATTKPSPDTKPSSTPSIIPTTSPEGKVTPSVQPTVTPTTSPEVAKDNKTSFSIKNKATIKKTAKIKVKDKDKIKKITLNGKKIKIKSNKTSITIKLKSYKKYLKKKGKWNTFKVTDKKGNVVTIKFKTK